MAVMDVARSILDFACAPFIVVCMTALLTVHSSQKWKRKSQLTRPSTLPVLHSTMSTCIRFLAFLDRVHGLRAAYLSF